MLTTSMLHDYSLEIIGKCRVLLNILEEKVMNLVLAYKNFFRGQNSIPS